jgi:hypothetical protein
MPTVNMVTVKLHLNSVISTKGARYCMIDLKDFYLMTLMACPKYMRMKLKDLPAKFVELYNLTNKVNFNGYIHIKIQKGMYGLPQAGVLAQELLKKRLNKHGYQQSPITPGLWHHNFRPILFSLCVDDSGIKYVGRKHAKHLATILNKHCKCWQDWDGQRYLGMNIYWDYNDKKYTSPCLNTCLRHSLDFNTQHQKSPSINRTHM